MLADNYAGRGANRGRLSAFAKCDKHHASGRGKSSAVSLSPASEGSQLLSKSDEAARREQRLAAKLRENLVRRKQQARGRAAGEDKPDQSSGQVSDIVTPDALKPAPDSDS